MRRRLVLPSVILSKHMANLLTPETKKKLIHDRQLRQLVVGLGLINILLLLAVTFNLALWLNFNIQKIPFSSQFLSNNPSTTEEIDFSVVENNLTQLAKLWPKSDWSTAIAKVESLQPKTIKIYQFAGVFSEKDKSLNFVLVGESSDRQDLVDLADRLRQDDFFSQVDLPIESLLTSSNGQFTLNLTLRNDD